MSEIRLIETQDGSHSLYLPDMNETYHSFHGAIQEAQHVFLKMGIQYYLAKHKSSHLKILEVGFGTGLNALLTYKELASKNIETNYVTIEPFPIEPLIWNKLNYVELLNMQEALPVFEQMHGCNFNEVAKLSELFQFKKLSDTLENIILPSNDFDIVFFDAFAPSKQPQMWQLNLLQKIVDSLNTGGVFVTYCAQGQFKRDIKATGLNVETLPGPPGKKEMVRGVKV